jgi:thiosulfate/3-mercaptopyruvate sulfurtransferase
MKIESRIAVLVLCLAVTGYVKYTEQNGSDHETCLNREFPCRPPAGRYKSVEEKTVAGTTEPWTPDQLMAPADLAAVIDDPAAKKPVIICVGPGAMIKGSLDIGPVNEKENLEKLKQLLSKQRRNTNLIIYCGCCPFVHCPNIRPAFNLLNEMKFSNAHLLNIEHNLKTDWIAKGYPQKA